MLVAPDALEGAVLAFVGILLGPAYPLALRLVRRDEREPADPDVWPEVDVVVPAHDEAAGIAAKIHDLRALDYPPERLRFRIVDGASSDGTAERASAAIGGDPRFSVRRLGAADKTAQINAALGAGASRWVLVTDADARLGPATIRALVAKGESDPRIGAVGTTVRPAGAVASEVLHWNIADRLRLAEGARGAASIVTAPCYLFRRELAPSFPPDVVADDVHLAFRAAAAGRRVAFVRAGVEELRNPVSIPELFRHKYRKAHAYLREVFRFLPAVGGMSGAARTVFLWRAAQMLVVPSAAVLLGALTLRAAAAAGPPGRAAAALAGLLLLSRPRFRAAAGLAAALVGALLAATLSFPFFRQRPSFRKIDAARKPVADAAS